LTIGSSADALLSIINDILDFSKLDAGKIELDEGPFDPAALVGDVATLFAPRAAEKHIAFETSVAVSARRSFIGDALRLRQILLNLISNAVKFTETGGVVIRVTAISRGSERSDLAIEVEDSGIGIDDAAKSRLFQPFEQADRSMTRRFGGTGLGLSISKRLIELMGGSIALADRPGGGTVFSVTVPLRHAAQVGEASGTCPSAAGRCWSRTTTSMPKSEHSCWSEPACRSTGRATVSKR
jgi:signal transduction histidine kinase